MEVKTQFENLVIEGAAMRGYAYCGALLSLEEMGILSNMKRFAGTSVGAFFACCLAVGMSAKDLKSKLDRDLHPNDLIPYYCTPSLIYNLWKHYGMYSIDPLEKLLIKLIAPYVNKDITFQQLYEKTGKELVVVTCNLNKRIPVYLHRHSFPHLRIVDGVMMSVSIPLFFRPRLYDILGTPDYYVDGGIVNNYPIWIFNDLEKLKENRIEEIDDMCVSKKTLGLKILGSKEAHTPQVFVGRDIFKNVFQIVKDVINTLLLQLERSQINPCYLKQTIAIKTEGPDFVDMELSDDKKELLTHLGKAAVKEYFKL
jgi:patatin-like phospholipase/acyl hydrolase